MSGRIISIGPGVPTTATMLAIDPAKPNVQPVLVEIPLGYVQELLPCPFCGGDAGFERTGNRRRSCVVICLDCGCRHESPDEGPRSGTSWNTRIDR